MEISQERPPNDGGPFSERITTSEGVETFKRGNHGCPMFMEVPPSLSFSWEKALGPQEEGNRLARLDLLAVWKWQ